MDTLKKSSIQELITLLKTCKILNAENLIIDSDGIRAEVPGEGIFILDNNSTIEGLDNLGVTRISTLFNRIMLFNDESFDMDVELKEKDNKTKIISRLVLSNDLTVIEFRCADPANLKVLKRFKDPIGYTFELNSTSVALLARIVSAMNTDIGTFTSKKNSIYFKVSDVDGDSFTHLISSTFDIRLEDIEKNFSFNYNLKKLLPVIKNAAERGENLIINITTRGFINLELNGLPVYMAPNL